MLEVRNKVPFPDTEEEGHEIQVRLARLVRLGERFRNVAGVDVAYSRDDKWAYAAAVVVSTTNWSVVHSQRLKMEVPWPYESGMLGFREGPVCLAVLKKLAIEPDLILVDGCGLAHPRRFGLACHVGYALDFPTIGVAKTWPAGCRQASATLPKKRGSKSALLHDPSGDRVGFEVHTQDNTNPIYVSPGHRVSVEDAASLVLRCSPWFKNPEPLRQADQLANAFREEDK
jgi:deoxyribonuclease V